MHSRCFRTAAAGALLALAACGAPESPVLPTMSADAAYLRPALSSAGEPPIIGLAMLDVPTFDGSGQAVHPDVVSFPTPWQGWEYWMAFTPYPGGNSDYENPSIAVSHDGRHWSVPDGVANPLVPKPITGYNSDPDLTYDAVNNRLVMLYRQVGPQYNTIYSMSSTDGVHWTEPTVALRKPNHGMISPAMVLGKGTMPMVWYVDAGTAYSCTKRRTSVRAMAANTVDALTPTRPGRGWSLSYAAKLEQPGYSIWHIDVTWVPSKKEYWAVYPAYRTGTCQAEELFFAKSRDGLTWQRYQVPFMRRNAAQWTSMRVYRSSLLYFPERDALRVYISGSGGGPQGLWRLGYVEYTYQDFLMALAKGVPELPTLPDRAPSALRMSQEP